MYNDIYTIKRKTSVNDSDYDKASYRKALNSERIKELINSNKLECEFFFNDNERKNYLSDHIRYQQINIQNVCAKIIDIHDDEIIIQLTENHYGDILKEILETNSDNVLAHIRGISKVINHVPHIMTIITFDIVKC